MRTRSTGVYSVKKAALAAFAGLKYQHDTVADGAVQARIILAKPELAISDLMMSGYVSGDSVTKLQTFFAKWFSNKVQIISLDHVGSFGQSVEVAAKLDLSNMDSKNLMIYSYDKTTNSYNRIVTPNYWIDSNGYLHFTTELAGAIVVSDGAFVRK